MRCPFCTTKKVVKNGHAPSSKQRWKCSKCHKSFDTETGRNFPPTSIPFPIIALFLYRSEHKSCSETVKDVNFTLQVLQTYFNIIIYPKGTVPYSTVYQWKHQYGPYYDKLISFEESKKYYFNLIRTKGTPFKSSKPVEEPPDVFSFIPVDTEKALKKIKVMTDYIGIDCLEYMKKNRDIMHLLLNHIKNNTFLKTDDWSGIYF